MIGRKMRERLPEKKSGNAEAELGTGREEGRFPSTFF